MLYAFWECVAQPTSEAVAAAFRDGDRALLILTLSTGGARYFPACSSSGCLSRGGMVEKL